MKNHDWDFIILGQGLAGSLLAWNLIQRGKRVLVIDQPHKTSASQIAAGLINPVTGKRLVKQNNADELLTTAEQEYNQLKKTFNSQFFYSKHITRLFQSEENALAYNKRLADLTYKNYIGEKFEPDTHPILYNPLGGFKQYQTGYVNTLHLLSTLKKYFSEQQCYQETHIEYSQVQLNDQSATINHQHTKQLIFCEGYRTTTNPWFNWLTFKLAKGEILTLKSQAALPDTIINAGKWLLPTDTHTCKFGATYQWDNLDETPTDNAKKELLTAANKLFKSDMTFSLVEHRAGIRPCTYDTMPYIGTHPNHHQLGYFNGFGSKGSMLIPFYAKHFCENLLNKQPLNTDIDITRQWKSNA